MSWWRLPPSIKFTRQRNAAASLQALGQQLCNGQLLATYNVGFTLLPSLVATFADVKFYLADAAFDPRLRP